uniref:sodium-coupled monocarboxylate transporter 2-like isoform X1 n=1 Tax=Styela clava TaxID=7725 RepID=UPI00193939CF|nr:sodium-coupled monocarboxylate transporter 2-like isoform X1 [Styela clava]
MDSTDNAKKWFGAVDFTVFAIFLSLSTFIGVFFAFRDRKNNTTANYYFAGRKSNPIIVGLSMCVTYMSSFSLVGIPAEVYLVGTSHILIAVGITFAALTAIVYLIPTYHRLQLHSIFEYLELRFNVATRRVCSIIACITMVFYMGLNVYLPALTVSAVAPISLVWSIVLTAVICTFYTALGGMKAVIWTDVIQSVVMLIGAISLFFRGLMAVGGFAALNSALSRGERHTVTRPDFDITSRASPLTKYIGGWLRFTYFIGFTQPMVQRFQSCSSVAQARCSMFVYLPPTLLMVSLAIGNGAMMYAFFEGCDPVKSGLLKSIDQGIPYIILEVLHDLPGLAGLFVAAIFSASLSTVSSNINSLSIVVVEDFVAFKWPQITDRTKLLVGKFIVAAIGLILLIVAYAYSLLKVTVVRLFLSLMGAMNGPMLGIFLLGFFIPWTNAAGALTGGLFSLVVVVWMTFGNLFLLNVPSRVVLPPRSINACVIDNSTMIDSFNDTEVYTIATNDNLTIFTTPEPVTVEYTFDQMMYSISFNNYIALATSMTIIVGLIVSFATGRTHPSQLDPKLFIPIVDSNLLPYKVRKFFRFGVPELKETETNNTSEIDNFLPNLG